MCVFFIIIILIWNMLHIKGRAMTSPEKCTVPHWSILDVILSERSSQHTWSVHLTSLEPEEKYKSVHLLLILSAFTRCGCKITNQLTNSWSPMQNTEKKTADWQQKRELIRNFQHNIALHEKETVSSALGDKVAPFIYLPVYIYVTMIIMFCFTSDLFSFFRLNNGACTYHFLIWLHLS